MGLLARNPSRRFLAGLVMGATLSLSGPCLSSEALADEGITKTWAIAEFGEPLYKDGLEHWPYANPDAPKGGKITLGAAGTFDSLNSLILKGEWPRSIGLASDSLMVGSGEEIGSYYGLIAETIEYPADKSYAIFNIRPEARWHDGAPITAEDFKFNFDMIQEHGRPFLKSFYKDFESAEVLSDHRIRYNFSTRDSMKPLVLAAQMGPTSKAYWAAKDISKTTLEPPMASGPYRIKSLEAGRTITYERVDDYWARDLPVNKGLHNFDEIKFDYYRDRTVEFEAFKAGAIDFRDDYWSKQWSTGYNFPAVNKGQVIKREVQDRTPHGIQAFFFNLRLDKFADIRVREAITNLFDFETTQRTLMYGQYTRIKSYFPNSDFGAAGQPTDKEVEILTPFQDQLAPEVLSDEFLLPVTDGSGRIRANMRKAIALFKEAGWSLKDGKLINNDSGEQMRIEFLLVSPALQPLTNAFVQNLKRAGIDASIRIVDAAQYQNRLDDFDFDVTTVRLNFFPPPGPELKSYYGSEAADVRGSANMAGIKNPVADALIDQLIAAEDLESLKATSRALDRVLLWNHYVIPHYYNDQSWFAYWNRFAYPDTQPKYSFGTPPTLSHGFPATWWIDPELEAVLPKKN
ncbi:MAG: extracellular solute-binding protein [Pseudomonadota bacterium]